MNILRYIFNFACFSTAFGMSIFWCYKYWLDNDLCLVDYKNFESSLDVDYPTLSFCLVKPLIETKLKEYDESLTGALYHKFLLGHHYHKGLENISFNEVTYHLENLYIGDYVLFRNGTMVDGFYGHPLNTPFHGKPKITFVGPTPSKTFEDFYKCYGIRVEDKSIKSAYFLFNMSGISTLMNGDFVTFFHLPNQMMLASETFKEDFWSHRNKKDDVRMIFTINQVDVLKRRNKRTKSCVPKSSPFDEKMVNDQIKRNGCRAPYQNTTVDVPICASKEGMAGASLDPHAMIEKISPCTCIKNLIYSYVEGKDNEDFNGKLLGITLNFPKEFKEIIQERAVDIQTVIGNAGGYVGLFLGKLRI